MALFSVAIAQTRTNQILGKDDHEDSDDIKQPLYNDYIKSVTLMDLIHPATSLNCFACIAASAEASNINPTMEDAAALHDIL